MFYWLWEEMLGISKKQKLLGVVTHPHLVSRKMLVVKYVTYRESQQSEEKNNNKAVIYVDLYLYLRIVEGPSWSWLYGSCKSNYLFNQCLSPLKLWVRTPLRRGVHDTTVCDQVCQLLATDRWFSSGTPVSSTNKTDRQNITEILLKVALSTIKPNQANHRSHCWKIFFSIQFLFVLNVVFINIKTTISSISFIS